MEESMLSQDEFDVWKREIKHQFHIKNYHAFPLLFTDEANVSSTGNWSFDDMLILNNQRMRKAEQDRAEMLDQIKKAQNTIDTSSQKIINLEHTVNSLNNTVNSLNEQVGCLVNMLKRRYESCGEIRAKLKMSQEVVTHESGLILKKKMRRKVYQYRMWIQWSRYVNLFVTIGFQSKRFI